MIAKTIQNRDPKATSFAKAPTHFPVFDFNAQYCVASDEDANQLLNDASCFLACARELIRNAAMDAEGEGVSGKELVSTLWSAFHLINLGTGVVDAGHNAMLKKSKESMQ